MRSTVILLLFLAASFAAAAIGGIATGPGVRDWYPTLNKPTWNPPAWLFGPVWTFLYLCIAGAGFLAWKKAGFAGAKGTLLLFTLQLILNATWSWVFFGLRLPGWAFAEIILLLAAILATTIALFRVSPPAGFLFVPYLAWVTFASVLNGTIWRLNT
jgi:tryptophan-rich sensory protein